MSNLPYVVMSTQLKFKAEYDAINITGVDLLKFKLFWNRFKQDVNGKVGIESILIQLGFGDNRFMRKIFNLIYKSDENSLDFQEFVFLFWNFCSLSATDLAKFAFKMYDSNDVDHLSSGASNMMMRHMYGKYIFASKVDQKLNNEIRQLGTNGVSMDAWVELCSRNVDILDIASLRQQAMRHETLGCERWCDISAARTKLTQGEFKSVNEMFRLLSRMTRKKKVLFGLNEENAARTSSSKGAKLEKSVLEKLSVSVIKSLRGSFRRKSTSSRSTVAVDDREDDGEEEEEGVGGFSNALFADEDDDLNGLYV